MGSKQKVDKNFWCEGFLWIKLFVKFQRKDHYEAPAPFQAWTLELCLDQRVDTAGLQSAEDALRGGRPDDGADRRHETAGLRLRVAEPLLKRMFSGDRKSPKMKLGCRPIVTGT